MRNGLYLLPSRSVLLDSLVKQLECEAEPTAQSWSCAGLAPCSRSVADLGHLAGSEATSMALWDSIFDFSALSVVQPSPPILSSLSVLPGDWPWLEMLAWGHSRRATVLKQLKLRSGLGKLNSNPSLSQHPGLPKVLRLSSLDSTGTWIIRVRSLEKAIPRVITLGKNHPSERG